MIRPAESTPVSYLRTLVRCLTILSLFLALAPARTVAEGRQEQPSYTITTASAPGLGTYLTDSSGHALYYSTNDLPGHSNCTGGCEVMWPPFTVSSVSLPAGLNPNSFGFIVRNNGRRQLTYHGWPLYLYSRDWSPGSANGQGLYDSWYVVQPALFGPTAH